MALLLSFCAHLVVWGGYEIGKKFSWWQPWHTPTRLHKTEKKNPPVVAQNAEPPTVFVEVSHPDTEPPKTAKYYSDKNSRAANPEADKESNQPKLNGEQKNVPKTENVPRFSKLQPSPPQEHSEESKPAKKSQPSSPMNIGDLALAKTPNEPASGQKNSRPQPQRKQPRPRTLAEALHQLPGQQMQQEGGVRRQLKWSSLDVRATPFGDYDRAIIEAVTQHWYDLLDSHRFAQDRTGKVVLSFKLNPDGSVDEMKIQQTTVGELLAYVCEESVQASAPFAPWPSDMRRMIGKNYREVTFTFYYY